MSSEVSVIIPVYNGAAYLAEAVASILTQDVQPLEVLVMDDGSTDGTAAVAKSFGGIVRHVPLEHAGQCATRNRGIAAARGAIIASLDADDLWMPGKLRLQLTLLGGADRPEIVLGYTQRYWMPSASGHTTSGALPVTTVPEFAMSFGAALVRRAVFDRIGVLNAACRATEDIDWMMRAREAGVPFHIHPEVVQLYRRHDRNLTNDMAVGKVQTLRTIKRSLDRRRAAGGGIAQDLGRLSEPRP